MAARIRTIKPEFWTDPAIISCSHSARLFFIGMLNFADDEGNIEGLPLRLKIQIFPADEIEIEPLLEELKRANIIIPYEVDNRLYFHIRTFKKHQVINRPSPSQHPSPPRKDTLHPSHGELSEHSQRKEGKEGKKEGRKGGKKRPVSKKTENNQNGRDWDTGLGHIRETLKEMEGQVDEDPDEIS